MHSAASAIGVEGVQPAVAAGITQKETLVMEHTPTHHTHTHTHTHTPHTHTQQPVTLESSGGKKYVAN